MTIVVCENFYFVLYIKQGYVSNVIQCSYRQVSIYAQKKCFKYYTIIVNCI